MADEKDDVAAVTVAVPSSYWLDACEEDDGIIPCELIGDFTTDFGNNGEIGDSFFGGIDHILDSIKSGAGLPTNVNGKNMEIDSNSANISKEMIKVEGISSDVNVNGNGSSSVINCVDIEVENVGFECKMEVDLGNDLIEGDNGKINGEVKVEGGQKDSEGRDRKRARPYDGYRDEKGYSSRGLSYGSVQGSNGRKRYREFEEDGRRDNRNRRVDYYNGRRESRETKGYWEREKPGSKEIVYRLGSYEAEKMKDGNKGELEKKQEGKGRGEKDEGSLKERKSEEHARHYQLEVLEQAKQRNTIAFLETGAGKTLIAVLLIRSTFEKLQLENKKMVAIFLVPKVPLVYQVKL